MALLALAIFLQRLDATTIHLMVEHTLVLYLTVLRLIMEPIYLPPNSPAMAVHYYPPHTLAAPKTTV